MITLTIITILLAAIAIGIILYTVYYDWNSPRCFNCFHLMEVVDIEETLTDIIYHYKCPKCGRTRTIKIPKR
jgi:transposase-like protein